MRRDHVVLVVVLLVGGALAWLLLGESLRAPGPGVPGDGPDGGEATARTPGGDGAGPSRASPPERDRAVLFGRPRDLRAGRGQLGGRLADVEDSAPVGGARLVLTGRAFGGEDVVRRQASGEDGWFRFADVPAGDDYDLKVEADAHPGRLLPGLAVRRGGVTDLGTIWLGATATFEGRVVDADGEGVGGAEVRVHLGHASLLDVLGNMSELLGTLDREPEPLARVRSAADGRFRFDALDPGPVTVHVTAPGYAPALATAAVPPAGATARPLVVRLRQGRVVAGHVVDAEGRGVRGARVAAVNENNAMSFLYGRTFSTTQPDGSFRIDMARDVDEVTLLAAATGYPTTSTKARPGDEDVEIVLLRGATLALRVLTEPDDVSLEGAEVFVGVGNEASVGSEAPKTFAAGRTDRVGVARFDTRPGQLQMVMVTHPESPSGIWMGGMRGIALPGAMRGPDDPTIEPGRNEMTFRIAATLVVRGTVTDPDGRPVVGARISGFAPLPFSRPALTDAAGRYRLFLNESLGWGAVIVRADGFVQDPASLTVDPSEAEGGALVHDVALERACVVSGRVLDEEGRPVVGAEVLLDVRGDSGGLIVDMRMLQPIHGLAGRAGRYVLDGVPTGEGLRVVARHPGLVEGTSARFDVAAGGAVIDGKDVVLKRGGVLEVRVEDPRGRPVAGAKVELAYDRDDEVEWDPFDLLRDDARHRTGADGRIRQTGVPAGEVTITATHDRHAAGRGKVRVDGEGPSPVTATVVLPRAVVVTGRVLDEDGRPVSGATVYAVPTTGETAPPVTAKTDENGRFRLEGLPEGAIEVRATAKGLRPRTLGASAPTADLEIRLPRAASDPATRRREIQARLGELAGRLGSAASDAERDALLQELQALTAELAELEGDDEE